MAKSRQIEYETNDISCKLVTSHKKDKYGYIRVKRNGKLVNLHRYLYEQSFGKIPDGLLVRHKCDNRPCINLDHLELGTHQDNMDDMVKRGRSRKVPQVGEGNPRAVINEEIVKTILSDSSSTNIALGEKYGVTHSTISAIRRRKTWKHVTV